MKTTGTDRLKLSLSFGTAIGAAVVLFAFPPAAVPIYPPCIFYAVTGLRCPACGGLRAAHELLHGNIGGAAELNLLLVALTPLLVGLLTARFVKQFTGSNWAKHVCRPLCVWVLATAAIAFGIARNLF